MTAIKKTETESPHTLRVFGSLISRASEDGVRKALFVASTEARDRHASVIKISAWEKRLKRYNENGIIAYMHHTSSGWMEQDFNPDYIIGTGRAYIEDGRLMCEVTFEKSLTNPLADKIWNKLEAGILKAMSVGFIGHDGHWGDPDEGEDSGTFYFTDVELVECSIVNIPSNYEALKRGFDTWMSERKPKEPSENKELAAALRVQVEFFTTIN